MVFSFMESSAALHTRDEEEGLFPLMQAKLAPRLAGVEAKTPVEVMEGEHRLADGVLTRIKELARLIEQNPRAEGAKALLDEFVEKGYWIIQLYEGHIWKENNILFPMAERLLSPEEVKRIADVMNENRDVTSSV